METSSQHTKNYFCLVAIVASIQEVREQCEQSCLHTIFTAGRLGKVISQTLLKKERARHWSETPDFTLKCRQVSQ